MHTIKSFTKKHSTVVRLLALVLAFACAVPLLSQAVSAENTYVITDGDQVTVHTTYETNPATVLDEVGLELSDVDVFETAENDGVSEITVRRGMTVQVYSGGNVMQIISYGETVEAMFTRMGIPLAENSIVSVPLDEMTYEGMEILVQSTLTSTDSYTAVIPFETKYQETNLLDKGVEVILTAGVDGQKLCTAEVTYIDGEESSRELLTEEVVSEPVTQVVAIGTGKSKGGNKKPIIGDGVIITGSGDVLTYTHRDTFKATAYCRTDEGGEYTSTGTRTRVGAIAVDPRVIPYGTRMFIMTKDGSYIYGVATAEDCGGAIKGKRLDLFYETDPECRRFGRRDCDVYFLG